MFFSFNVPEDVSELVGGNQVSIGTEILKGTLPYHENIRSEYEANIQSRLQPKRFSRFVPDLDSTLEQQRKPFSQLTGLMTRSKNGRR